MIIVKLIGGLGNQMFQYAMGRAVAYQRNDILKLDISEFSHYHLRRYSLHHFQIQESFATRDEVQKLQNFSIKIGFWKIPLSQYLGLFIPYYKKSYFIERTFRYDPNVFKAPKDVIFSGYWQSEKYFKSIEDIIRKDFKLKSEPDECNLNIMELINKTNSVCIHVRRGDYIKNAETFDYYGLCSLEYYSKAIQHIIDNVDEPVFFVFSDDIEWVKKNLNIKKESYYVDHNGSKKDYLDLWLMSHCKHHIIANSSFSWWGAWLNTYPKKIIIAPKKWFNNNKIDTSDLIPNSWIKL